jgi:hypothetical protein
MKTQHNNLKIFIASTFLFGLLIVACKKQNPSQPINIGNCTTCTVCPENNVDTVLGTTGGYMDSTNYAVPTDFIGRNGGIASPSVLQKTPTGYYGGNGCAIDFNVTNLNMSPAPDQVSFTHCRFINNTNGLDSNLINVKFANTPTIVTIPDSLNYYLAPYGYTTQVFHNYSQVNMGNIVFTQSATADSIVISGVAITTATIGANLFESELRNICFTSN